MRASISFVLLFLMALAGLIEPTCGVAQEAEPEYLPTVKWPEASAEFVTEFVKSVKATPRYQFAEALKREKVETEIEKWKATAGVDATVSWKNYLLWFLESDYRSVNVSDKGEWALRVSSTSDSLGKREFLILQQVTATSSRGFRISTAALKELELVFLDKIIVRRSLNRVVSRYSVQNEQLSAVVAALCKEAAAGRGNVDFVVRSDPGSQVQISMQMTGRTVFECLVFAATSVGWEVYVSQVLQGQSYMYPMGQFTDWWVSLEQAEALWCNRDLVNLRDQPQSPVVTPLDALKEAFQRSAKQALEERFVIMLKPQEKK
jgi:hypothetical protein